MARRITLTLLAALAGIPLLAAVSPDTVVQLQAMNNADCMSSEQRDWDAFARTLAPEYVGIEADGSRETRDALIADLKKMPKDDVVTDCSTTVTNVVQEGDHYRLFGIYTEDGIKGTKRIRYHTVERIRDTWRHTNGVWLQTESLSYEMTIFVNGRAVVHKPMTEAARR